jgi:hypothetical protein
MSKKRLAKLYEDLTERERARLAFHYLANDNEAEVDRIVATIPRETFRVPAAGFMDYFDGCRWMAVLWSVNHWIARQRVSAATAAVLVGFHRKDDDLVDEMTERVRVWESSLVALDDALDAVCKEHDIDPADIRRLTDAEPYSAIRPDVKPDPEIFELRKQQLETAISG